MNIALLSPSLSRDGGGIFEIERSLAKALVGESGVKVRAIGLRDHWTEADRQSWFPVETTTVDVVGMRGFGWAPALERTLSEVWIDLVHLQALWMYTSWVSHKWTLRTGRPHMVTLNGMLEPWALAQSRWKKRIAWSLYENRNLRGAACLQVNTEAELESARFCGLTDACAIIPNGVDLPLLADSKMVGNKTTEGAPKLLAYLGRLHPKKGLRPLLEAWGSMVIEEASGQDSWVVGIAGWDQGDHEKGLKRLLEDQDVPWVDLRDGSGSARWPDALAGLGERLGGDGWALVARKSHGPEARVLFLGPLFGKAKDHFLRASSAFILPSFSEGLPMAGLEAMAYRLPLLITPQSNLAAAFVSGAALRIEPEAGSIKNGLHQLIEMSDADRREVGAQGRRLVEQRFTWPKVAAEMRKVYEWVLGGGPKPGCVVTE